MRNYVVAIVGRPNVGKSSLFNKITGKRISIVEDTPGVTRDRIYFEIEYAGRTMALIDTGGIENPEGNEILKQMRLQAELAVEHADVIVFLTDIQSGPVAADTDIARYLMKSGKPIVLAVNKIDTIGDPPPEFYEFYSLGLGDPIAVSALHGTGANDILDKVVEYLPESEKEEEEADDETIRVAVIGKPNAGKSSIINRLTGEERMIVSGIPGTTRDAVDTEIVNEYGKYVFIDTAGIRRQAKIDNNIEYYSVLRANMAVERADVCLVMIDAEEGVTVQDERVAGIGHNAGKASVIVINKWDLIEKDGKTADSYIKDVYKALAYMTYAPVIFVSAKTGQRTQKLYEMINKVHESSKKRITTGMLNDILIDAMAKAQPPTDKGRRLKIYYMTQTSVTPPTFVCFCNEPELFHFSYQRYIENTLRDVFGFEGTPIKIIVKGRGEQ